MNLFEEDLNMQKMIPTLDSMTFRSCSYALWYADFQLWNCNELQLYLCYKFE